MHGFCKVAAATPQLVLANPAANAAAICRLLDRAESAETALIAFPELCLSGYTCGDLFHQQSLLEKVLAGLETIRQRTVAARGAVIVGAPLLVQGRLYNCAVVLYGGRYLGVVPKSFLPNYKEFYEKRWFSSGRSTDTDTIALGGAEVAFGCDLLFGSGPQPCFAVELCEDLWNVVPPSSYQAVAGATILVNISASNELVGKADYRRNLVISQSARCVAAYVYTSAGIGESVSDLVFGGHLLIAENGVVLAENQRFQRAADLLSAEVDCQRLAMTRLTETSFADNPLPPVRRIPLAPPLPALKQLTRAIEPRPFVPSDAARRQARCREIFAIQSSALAARLAHTKAETTVIGVSGGLDSTLALLVCLEAWQRLGLGPDRILAVTMPGFGTSDRTYQNAVKLCRELGAELREIDISAACRQHFADLGHDGKTPDVTYENVQARERTQVLMDLANLSGGIVVGTGDLSEIALGWCTYNGDHMSMYAVNCSVPKTLIRYLIDWVAEQHSGTVAAVLRDVLATPVSPELLPAAADGSIAQATESVIGPYELHDFFLYHTVKYGAAPAKVQWLAEHAFSGVYDRERIAHWLALFLQRFHRSQFKRNCVPDGPKVGTISLSPRGDWRMPADADPA